MDNKHLIYEMLGYKVSGELEGVVEKVSRNIHTGKIEITMNATKYHFDEPDKFLLSDNVLYFIYGDSIEENDSDSFSEVGSQAYRISADEYFSQNKEKIRHTISFNLIEMVSLPKDRWRKRQAFK